MVVLRVFSLVYSAFRILIGTENVIKIILMLSGCRFRSAFIFDAFCSLRMKLKKKSKYSKL